MKNTKDKQLELFTRKEMMGGMKVRRSLDGSLIDAYIEALRLIDRLTDIELSKIVDECEQVDKQRYENGYDNRSYLIPSLPSHIMDWQKLMALKECVIRKLYPAVQPSTSMPGIYYAAKGAVTSENIEKSFSGWEKEFNHRAVQFPGLVSCQTFVNACLSQNRLMPSETLRRLMSYHKATALKDIDEASDLSDACKADAAESVEWFFTSYEKILRNGYFLELEERKRLGAV